MGLSARECVSTVGKSGISRIPEASSLLGQVARPLRVKTAPYRRLEAMETTEAAEPFEKAIADNRPSDDLQKAPMGCLMA